MELREFVRNTIADVFGGVVDAQQAVKDIGGEVVPKVDPNDFPNFKGAQQELPAVLYTGGIVAQIQFDVALTEGESTGTKGGVGVLLGAFGVGGQAREDVSVSSLTRIRFSVPVILPISKPR